MSLSAYKLDKAFTDGVEIRLDMAPDDVFLVKLPSLYNRGYAQAVYSGTDLSSDDVSTTQQLVVTKGVIEEAFLVNCVVSLNDEPLDEDFMECYPEAVAELFSKAQDLANDLERKVETSVKKSPATSSGKGDGQEKKSSTPALSSAAG